MGIQKVAGKKQTKKPDRRSVNGVKASRATGEKQTQNQTVRYKTNTTMFFPVISLILLNPS